MCESLKLYYNVYDNSKKTNYTDMISNPNYKNSIFLYGANTTNCGPAGGIGGGSAAIGDEIKAFGILTGDSVNSDLGIDSKYVVDYKTSYTNLKKIYGKSNIPNINNLFLRIEINPDNLKKTQYFKQHVYDQIYLLCNYIDMYNGYILEQEEAKTNYITSVIFPSQINSANNEKEWGYAIFSDHTDIDKKVEYILDSLKNKFKINDLDKKMLNALTLNIDVANKTGMNSTGTATSEAETEPKSEAAAKSEAEAKPKPEAKAAAAAKAKANAAPKPEPKPEAAAKAAKAAKAEAAASHKKILYI